MCSVQVRFFCSVEGHCTRVRELRRGSHLSGLGCGCHRHLDCSLLQAGWSKLERAGTEDLLHGSRLLSKAIEIMFNEELYYWKWPFYLQTVLCLFEKLCYDFFITKTLICQKKVPLCFPPLQALNSLGKISKPNSHFQIFFFFVKVVPVWKVFQFFKCDSHFASKPVGWHCAREIMQRFCVLWEKGRANYSCWWQPGVLCPFRMATCTCSVCALLPLTKYLAWREEKCPQGVFAKVRLF